MIAALLLAAAVEKASIAADETRVVAKLGDAHATTHQLSIVTSDGASPKLGFTLVCGTASWQWQLSRRTFALEHPAGDCTLTVRGDDYKPAERKLSADARATINLYRLPVLAGVITDSGTRAPIAGADILLPDGTVLATSREDGRFRAAVAGPWPSFIRVLASGHAAKRVAVPKTVADAELTVALARGGTIALTLAPPLGEEDVTWELRRENGEVERSGQIPAGQTTAIIEGIDAGSWHLVFKGEGSLERVAVPVTVRDGDTSEATVAIEPAAVELDVRLGQTPIAGAKVEVWFGDRLWSSTITTDAEGRALEQIWQRGSYVAYVSHAPQVRLWRASRELTADGLTSWAIDVPARRVRGRITDQNGKPIGDATVDFRYTTDDGITIVTAMRSAADGVYEFDAVPVGKYRLAVSKKGYQPVETPLFTLIQETALETRDVTLQPVAGRFVTVVNMRGVPLPHAAVYLTTQNGTRRAGGTDEQGRLLLPLAEHEAGIAFALPASGSIGMKRFESLLQSEEMELTIRVPDGVASLEIVAESDEGEPIADLATLLRVDGVLLPPTVRSGMTNDQGLPHATDAAGRMLLTGLPPGRYELWPLNSREDYLAVLSANPPPAPVNLTLTPGHHTARLKFHAKEN